MLQRVDIVARRTHLPQSYANYLDFGGTESYIPVYIACIGHYFSFLFSEDTDKELCDSWAGLLEDGDIIFWKDNCEVYWCKPALLWADVIP